MIDNVLQSFCERCGRRFTQPAPAERSAPAPGILGRLRRRPDAVAPEPEGSSAPLAEAFGDTFHFCLECRRYNCVDCWNAAEGHCLSCRPATIQATQAPQAAEPPTMPGSTPRSVATGTATTSHPVGASEAALVWPSDDLQRVPGSPSAPGQSASRGSETGEHEPLASTERDVWAMDGVPAAPGRDPAGADPVVPMASTEVAGDLPWGAVPQALDPWRGVVFSADEVDTSTRGTPVSSEPLPTTAARSIDRSAPSTPATPVVDAAVASAMSKPAATVDEVGVLASLIESEPHVDAAGWARASSAVVGMGSLKVSATDEVTTDEAAATDAVPTDADESAMAELATAPARLDTVAVDAPGAEGPVRAEEPRADEGRPAPEGPQAAEGLAYDQDVDVGERLAAVQGPAVGPETPAGSEHMAMALVDEEVASEASSAAQEPVDLLQGERDAPAAVMPMTALAETPQPDAPSSPAHGPVTDAESPLAIPPPEVPEEPTRDAVADDLGELGTPRPSPPLAPISGLEVWVTPIEQGPFAQPYQPSPPQATVYPADVARAAAPLEPAAPLPAPPQAVAPTAAFEAPAMAAWTSGELPASSPSVPPIGTPAPMAPPVPAQATPPPLPPAARGPLQPPPPPPASPPGVVPTSAPLPAQPTAASLPPAWQSPYPESLPAPPVARTPGPPARPAAAGSRACPNCALPLSTKARFCRRCGAPQPA